MHVWLTPTGGTRYGGTWVADAAKVVHLCPTVQLCVLQLKQQGVLSLSGRSHMPAQRQAGLSSRFVS
jgi:hypothetical protein